MSSQPSDKMASPPLAQAISNACGSRHTALNNEITKSMPLSLPPKAKEPSLFCAGLSSFGMIYLTFEKSWHQYLSTLLQNSTSEHSKEIHSFLSHLLPEGIERSTRIKNDIKYLSRSSSIDFSQILRLSTPVQRRFKKYIQHSITEKPHHLYAYGWCMYMAVFAGGRIIREWLADAGEDFWDGHGGSDNENNLVDIASKRARLDRPGYSFLSFDGDDDGESIKQEFIKNLYAAEDLFTPEEREDVVKEAQQIFDWTIDLVKDMAEHIKPSLSLSTQHNAPPSYTLTPSPPPIYETDLEKGFADTDALLSMRATDAEWREWQAAGRERQRHGVIFWIQLVTLVVVGLMLGAGLIIGSKIWLPRALGMGFPANCTGGEGKLTN